MQLLKALVAPNGDLVGVLDDQRLERGGLLAQSLFVLLARGVRRLARGGRPAALGELELLRETHEIVPQRGELFLCAAARLRREFIAHR